MSKKNLLEKKEVTSRIVSLEATLEGKTVAGTSPLSEFARIILEESKKQKKESKTRELKKFLRLAQGEQPEA